MNNCDQLLRFTFKNSDVRGEIVRVHDSLGHVFEKQQYPLAIQSILAELISAACLLSATLKFDGILTIQASGSGPVTTLMAECSNTQEIRAIARWNKAEFAEIDNPQDIDLRKLLGKSLIAITINPTTGKRYQGIVPLEDAQLARCLESYFRQSEQLETRLWLQAELDHQLGCVSSCTGFLLQRLPGHAGQDWEHITHLAATLKTKELLSLDFKEILFRLYHQDPVNLHESVAIRYSCSCSKDRIEQMLVGLGLEELIALAHQQKEISIKCEFCGQGYLYDQVDLGALIHKQHLRDTDNSNKPV